MKFTEEDYKRIFLKRPRWENRYYLTTMSEDDWKGFRRIGTYEMEYLKVAVPGHSKSWDAEINFIYNQDGIRWYLIEMTPYRHDLVVRYRRKWLFWRHPYILVELKDEYVADYDYEFYEFDLQEVMK